MPSPNPVFWTVEHTGTRFVLFSGVKNQMQIPFSHFTYANLPEDCTGCVTILRDRKQTLASWIANKRMDPIENLTAQWKELDEFLKRGGYGAPSPKAAALRLGIPESGLIQEMVGSTDSPIKQALLKGTPPIWPEEYKVFASTL